LRLSHHTGFGDWIQISRSFSPQETDEITEIYWTRPFHAALREALHHCPEYDHVTHLYVFDEPLPDFLEGTATNRFLSILHRRGFFGSPLLYHEVADRPKRLPKDYVIVHPSTPFNVPEQRTHRDMGQDEWQHVFAFLDRLGCRGIVLNSTDEGTTPKDKRLLNLSGKTTFAEAVEVVKKAIGYVGIDSWMALLSGEFLPTDRLFVRTRNQYMIDHPWLYFPCARPTLVRSLGDEPLVLRSKPDFNGGYPLVQAVCRCLIGTRVFAKHEIFDCEPQKAEQLIRRGTVIPYEIK